MFFFLLQNECLDTSCFGGGFTLLKGHNLAVETCSLGDEAAYHYYNFILSSQEYKTREQFSIIFDIWLSSHEAIFLPSYMGQQLVTIVYIIIQALCLQQRPDEI